MKMYAKEAICCIHYLVLPRIFDDPDENLNLYIKRNQFIAHANNITEHITNYCCQQIIDSFTPIKKF